MLEMGKKKKWGGQHSRMEINVDVVNIFTQERKENYPS